MSQPALFHESIADAIKELIAALGGMKAVGVRMRPELPADHAGRWLADCLNADRREHLTPEQLVWLMIEGRKAGAHSVMLWIAAECGYQAAPVEPMDERAAMQREFVEATRRQEQLLARIERLAGMEQGSKIKAVA